MAEESFILVNLKEAEGKKLAQVISNETSRKILDYLSTKNDATATEIAKEMNIPLSTAHYNLQHLLEAKLIQADEFHYSEKGKEVDHYKLSNKFVIIAPQSSKFESVKEKLMKILPVAALSLAGAGIISVLNKGLGAFAAGDLRTAGQEMLEAAPTVASAQLKAAAFDSATNTIIAEPNIALWFLAGSFTALILYLLLDLFRKK